MKEIDLKTIQDLIASQIEALNIKYIIIFVVINLSIAVINWLLNKNIKNLESRIYNKKVREDRRLVIIEEVYSDLVSFTYILDKEEMKNSFDRIGIVEKKVSENRLYINSKMNNKISNYLDYLKKIASDFRFKNFDTENKMLCEIEKEFNK